MNMSKRHAAAVAVASCLVAGSVAAARADTIHERGTVMAVDGATVTIKDRDGKTVTLNLDDGWKIGGVAKATMADIKPGTFIGTATSGEETGPKALEVVVFPAAMKGTGEGHYAWDLEPKSMMTNATVDREVKGTDGKTVTLSYKGGETTVAIDDATPIVRIVDAARADLVPGAKVFVSTPGIAGGRLEKGFLAVGKDGVTPPM